MKQKKKSRHKMSHKVYALVVMVLGLVIILLALFLLFYVQTIEVKGNEYTDSQEIIDTVKEDPFSINSLYLLYKYDLKGTEIPGNLESMDVTLTAPWSVRVNIKEKKILGYVKDGDTNYYFDKDGVVVREDTQAMIDVPCIEGLDASGAELYKPLENESRELFQSILKLTRLVKEYSLSPDRIVCSSDDIHLYFGQVCVMLGDDITQDKVAQISPILEKLDGRQGTLHLEHFETEGSAVTFKPDELPSE